MPNKPKTTRIALSLCLPVVAVAMAAASVFGVPVPSDWFPADALRLPPGMSAHWRRVRFLPLQWAVAADEASLGTGAGIVLRASSAVLPLEAVTGHGGAVSLRFIRLLGVSTYTLHGWSAKVTSIEADGLSLPAFDGARPVPLSTVLASVSAGAVLVSDLVVDSPGAVMTLGDLRGANLAHGGFGVVDVTAVRIRGDAPAAGHSSVSAGVLSIGGDTGGGAAWEPRWFRLADVAVSAGSVRASIAASTWSRVDSATGWTSSGRVEGAHVFSADVNHLPPFVSAGWPDGAWFSVTQRASWTEATRSSALDAFDLELRGMGELHASGSVVLPPPDHDHDDPRPPPVIKDAIVSFRDHGLVDLVVSSLARSRSITPEAARDAVASFASVLSRTVTPDDSAVRSFVARPGTLSLSFSGPLSTGIAGYPLLPGRADAYGVTYAPPPP